jgi:hypothetical protein
MRRLLCFLFVCVALSTSVHAQSGVAIIQRTPSVDAVDINTDTTITIVFAQPVIPLVGTAELARLPAPVIITPAVEGRGEWLNSIVCQFTPSQPFPVNSVIRLRTSDSFVTVGGSTLTADEWAFTTALPLVNSVTVGKEGAWASSSTPLDLDWSVLVSFSQAFEQEQAEPLLNLRDASGASVPVEFIWHSATSVEIDPIVPLMIASEYTLLVADMLEGERVLAQPFTVNLSTIPLPYIKD